MMPYTAVAALRMSTEVRFCSQMSIDRPLCIFAEPPLHAVVLEAERSLAQQDSMQLVELVTAAILAAAERAAEAKEQSMRHRRQLPEDAQIFADGLAIGVAFLLQVRQPLLCCPTVSLLSRRLSNWH